MEGVKVSSLTLVKTLVHIKVLVVILLSWNCMPRVSSRKAQSITVYNYLAIQGPKSTSGYNTVQCGVPTPSQPNSFGQTYCFDMPLLKSQSLTSNLLGRVQGTFVFVAQSPSDTTAVNTIFVSETFSLNTSATPRGTFSGVGLEQVGQESSKPLTGGTDDFAFTIGVAITTPLSNGTDANGNFVAWFKYKFVFRST